MFQPNLCIYVSDIFFHAQEWLSRLGRQYDIDSYHPIEEFTFIRFQLVNTHW